MQYIRFQKKNGALVSMPDNYIAPNIPSRTGRESFLDNNSLFFSLSIKIFHIPQTDSHTLNKKTESGSTRWKDISIPKPPTASLPTDIKVNLDTQEDISTYSGAQTVRRTGILECVVHPRKDHSYSFVFFLPFFLWFFLKITHLKTNRIRQVGKQSRRFQLMRSRAPSSLEA